MLGIFSASSQRGIQWGDGRNAVRRKIAVIHLPVYSGTRLFCSILTRTFLVADRTDRFLRFSSSFYSFLEEIFPIDLPDGSRTHSITLAYHTTALYMWEPK